MLYCILHLLRIKILIYQISLSLRVVCRFIAVTQPIKYAKHKDSKRIHVMLALSRDVVMTSSSATSLMTRRSSRDAGAGLGHLGGYLFADSPRNELHRTPRADADSMHVLQLRFPHLLVHGVLLHPVRGDGFAVLAYLSHDPSADSQVHRHSSRSSVHVFVRAGATPPEVDTETSEVYF